MIKQVRRAYLIDRDPFTTRGIRRVLVGSQMVFIPGCGWMSLDFIQENYRLVYLPGEIEHLDWFDGWTNGKNARLPDWGWCYGTFYPTSFVACRTHKHSDGSVTVSIA